MRVNRIVAETYSEGPGCRFCIWVQGCPHRCEGCFATETWDFCGGIEYGSEDIKKQFELVIDVVEGITVLGGEPFSQAEELSELCRFAKDKGKNVIVFTGYTYGELVLGKIPGAIRLLENTDILIDGKFDKKSIDYSVPLVGSSNQNVLFLTDKIPKERFYENKNKLEIRVGKNGEILFNGMGNLQKLNEYVKKIQGDKYE